MPENDVKDVSFLWFESEDSEAMLNTARQEAGEFFGIK